MEISRIHFYRKLNIQNSRGILVSLNKYSKKLKTSLKRANLSEFDIFLRFDNKKNLAN